MPTKYKTNSHTVEAIQFDGTPQSAIKIVDWVISNATKNRVVRASYNHEDQIITIERHLGSTFFHPTVEKGFPFTVHKGNFVVMDHNNELFVCESDMFKANHKPFIVGEFTEFCIKQEMIELKSQIEPILDKAIGLNPTNQILKSSIIELLNQRIDRKKGN